MGKKWHQSKTIVIGLLQFLSGASLVLADFFSAGDFSAAGLALLANGLVMVALRLLTSEPIK